jgi:hypothetical protein
MDRRLGDGHCAVLIQNQSTRVVVTGHGNLCELRQMANTLRRKNVDIRIPDGDSDSATSVTKQNMSTERIAIGRVDHQHNANETEFQSWLGSNSAQIACDDVGHARCMESLSI